VPRPSEEDQELREKLPIRGKRAPRFPLDDSASVGIE
jgi:hypothetical protein